METENQNQEAAPVSNAPAPYQNKVHFLIFLMAGLILVGAGGYYLGKHSYQFPPISINQPKSCTLEVLSCPDGSAVRRSGPNCEFAPCPTLKPIIPNETSSWNTYTNTKYNFTIKYPSDLLAKEVPSNSDLKEKFQGIVQFGKDDIDYPIQISISAINTPMTPSEYVQADKDCPKYNEPSVCSKVTTGLIPNSTNVETAKIIHYQSINTFVKDGSILLDFGFSTNQPNYAFSEDQRNLYDQILSTFKFTANSSINPSPCVQSDLKSSVYWQGAGGSLAGSISLINQSNKSCSIPIQPEIVVVDSKGNKLAKSVGDTNTTKVITLNPSDKTSLDIYWGSQYCGPLPQEPEHLELKLTSNSSLIVPFIDPNGNTVLTVGTPPCDGGDSTRSVVYNPDLYHLQITNP